MTDFSTRYLTFQAQARTPRAPRQALGDTLDPVYETSDVPYTLYAVRANGKALGYVFGANQRTYSNIQVIAVTAADLSLKSVYLQIRSPLWETFRSEAFSEALSGLSLETYPTLRDCYVEGHDEGVADPTDGKESGDFRAILRALAKLHVLSSLLLEPGIERAGRDAGPLGAHHLVVARRAYGPGDREAALELDQSAPWSRMSPCSCGNRG